MPKSPSAHQTPKPMTTGERNARKAFRQIDADKALSEHEKAQRAFQKNYERLKSERLAREAAAAQVDRSKAKPKA
jgi:hypothetical protein